MSLFFFRRHTKTLLFVWVRFFSEEINDFSSHIIERENCRIKNPICTYWLFFLHCKSQENSILQPHRISFIFWWTRTHSHSHSNDCTMLTMFLYHPECVRVICILLLFCSMQQWNNGSYIWKLIEIQIIIDANKCTHSLCLFVIVIVCIPIEYTFERVLFSFLRHLCIYISISFTIFLNLIRSKSIRV